jgi:hypothetical protein
LKLQPIGFEEWQAFLNNHSQGSLFHRWEWQEIIEQGFGLQVNRLGIFDEQNKLVGLFPLVERKMSFLKLAGSPLSGVATPHSGPLGDFPLEDFVQALDEFSALKKIDYLELGLPCLGVEEVLLTHGYAVQELKTLDLDIPNTEEELWSNLEVRCRNAVRKAEKSGVTIVRPTSLDEWLEPYIELSVGVYARQGKQPPFSKQYFTALWKELYPKGDLVVLMAYHEGVPIAGGIFPKDRQVAYYLDGVSDREYNKMVPNNLVQWEYLKLGFQSGIKLYDMVGANIPSIAKFKQSFGSNERQYLYAYKNRTWTASVGRGLYAKYGGQIKKLFRK